MNLGGALRGVGGGKTTPRTRRRNASTHRERACLPPEPADTRVWKDKARRQRCVCVCGVARARSAGRFRGVSGEKGQSIVGHSEGSGARGVSPRERMKITKRTFCTRSVSIVRSVDEACDAMVITHTRRAVLCVVVCFNNLRVHSRAIITDRLLIRLQSKTVVHH